MKKALALLAIALFTAPVAHAQDDQSVRFGIKLAPNLSWVRPDTRGLESDGNKFGYSFGLLAEFPVGTAGNYRFASGLFLNTVGGGYTHEYTFVEELDGPEQTKALETDLNLRYVELPLTIKMMTNEIGYMRYFGQLGVSACFNIRAKADVETPILDESGFYTRGFVIRDAEDFQDHTNLFRAALVIGGGVEYNISGNTNLLFGVTYNNGFTNINRRRFQESSNSREDKKGKIMNDYLELTLGIFF